MMMTLNACFLIGLFLLGLGGLLLVVTPTLYLCGARRKPRWILGAALIYLLGVAFAVFWLTRPAALFEQNFGFPPTADVQDLRSEYFVLGDSGNTTLTFTASQGTAERIVQHRFGKRLADGPLDDAGWRHFHRGFSEQFVSEQDDLWYNAQSGRVRFHWQGVD